MSDQARQWSRAAERYEEDFVDPYSEEIGSPLLSHLEELQNQGAKVVADLGCGIGPLLPILSERFEQVYAVDFAPGMLKRAKERCRGLSNITFRNGSLQDLSFLPPLDIAVAINSLVVPDPNELQECLNAIGKSLKRGGSLLAIVPAMDTMHYHTMLLLDLALSKGMALPEAQSFAAKYGEHELYTSAFGEFRFQGLVQHFWQPFEIPYRLKRAGLEPIGASKVRLTWDLFPKGEELLDQDPPWDWYFRGEKK